jgi:hypothetical protein
MKWCNALFGANAIITAPQVLFNNLIANSARNPDPVTGPIASFSAENRVRLIIPLALLIVPLAPARAAEPLPGPRAMTESRRDVWCEAAIRQPGGPSYEFYEKLLPPLRYVNTAFRHYPIVLSAPAAPVKARWVSNGSGVNLRADKPPMWKEVGTPVAFAVGDAARPFGAEAKQLDGPRYAAGYLPVVQVGYRSGGAKYEQEAFAAVRAPLANHGAVFVRFTVREKPGRVIARIAADGLRADAGWVRTATGQGLVHFGTGWTWSDKNELRAELKPGQVAELVIFTKPIGELKQPPTYADERRACVEVWNALLRRGASFEIPEPIVQNAWRSIVIGDYLIAVGDRMHYSAGNAYDHLYEGECGDAVRSLLLFGHAAAARRTIGPLLAFNRRATRYHVAGHKLQLIAGYYWVTRDKEYLRETRPVWEPVVKFLRASRKTDNGLLPKDRYAGDINRAVYSLNSNANCWRGLRDMAAVLEDAGEREYAAELRKECDAFRRAILDAVAKSERKDAKPPFIPVALFDNEEPHDPLTATRTGSYYDLIIPYVLGSDVLGIGSDRETWIIEYLRQHGGLAMGMIRSTPHQGQFNNEPGVNVLYGLRYMLTQLRRGDRAHALAGFYGQLAQAMTRETFIGGEGSRFLRGDQYGRGFYLPPNSASNAMFLTTLRYLLIQDWDTDGDGRPETLRFLDAVPPRWLKDGATLAVDRAPTAFGEVSFRVESKLNRGEVIVTVQAPPRPPERWQLRLPNPPGYRITAVRVGGDELRRDADGRVDLSKRSGKFTIRYQIQMATKRHEKTQE